MASELGRHCERSEAIHRAASEGLDGFVALLLAMTIAAKRLAFGLRNSVSTRALGAQYLMINGVQDGTLSPVVDARHSPADPGPDLHVRRAALRPPTAKHD
jgi:hypothetical protein